MLTPRTRSTETTEGLEITNVHLKQAYVAKKLCRCGLSTNRKYFVLVEWRNVKIGRCVSKTSGKLLPDYFVQCFSKAIEYYIHLRTKLYVQTVVEKPLVLPFRFQCVQMLQKMLVLFLNTDATTDTTGRSIWNFNRKQNRSNLRYAVWALKLYH